MHRDERGLPRCPVGATIGKLAVMLVVLATSSMAAGAPGKDKDEQFSQIYRHTYDEVFQASQEAIERIPRLSVTATDKDKGTISGGGSYVPLGSVYNSKCTFSVHIEVVNDKPQTRVTIDAKARGSLPGLGGVLANQLRTRFLGELQQVLATYR